MPTAVDGPPVPSTRPGLWRITDRRSFDELRRRGRRSRRGCLTVTFVPPAADAPAAPPRAGFAVGRPVGGAVVRNRVRRRLRAALRQLVTDGTLPPGTYLVGATAEAATLAWPDLVTQLAEAVAEASR